MNNSYGHCESQPIHFTQWSNTSYAVFNSIGRIVHIGFLSNIIHGLRTVKALISHGFLPCRQAGLRLFELINTDEVDEDILSQLDPSVLMNFEELIVGDVCDHSTPFSGCISEDIDHIIYSIAERPFSGLFSFAGFAHFMRNSAFFYFKIN